MATSKGYPIQATDRESAPVNSLAGRLAVGVPSSSAGLATSNTPPADKEERIIPSAAVGAAGGDLYAEPPRAEYSGDEYEPELNRLGEEDTSDAYRYGPYFEYRSLVGSIAEKLRKENALRLAYVFDLPNWYYDLGPTYDPTSALRILIALESKGVFAPNKLSALTKALETIEREDLAEIVREFRRKKVASETVARSNAVPQQERSRTKWEGSSYRGRPPKPQHSISTTSLMAVEDANVFTDGPVYRTQSKPDFERHLMLDTVGHEGALPSNPAVARDVNQSVPHNVIEMGLQFALMNLKGLQQQISILRSHVTTANQNIDGASLLNSQSHIQSALSNVECSLQDSARSLEIAFLNAGYSLSDLSLSTRSTPVRDVGTGLYNRSSSVCSSRNSRKFSRSGSGGAITMSRQSSGLSTKLVTPSLPSDSGDAKKQLKFEHSTERDGTKQQKRGRHGYTKLAHEDPGVIDEMAAPHPGHMHPPTPSSSQVKIRRRWSRRDEKKLSRKGVLVWQIKVKKLKEWYSQKGVSLDSEDFFDVFKRKFKATLHPFGLEPDCGSYMTLCINCLDEIKSTQKIHSTDIVVSVIDPQSSQPPLQPICRQLERRGIRVIQQFISHAQVDSFLSDVIVVTIALSGKASEPNGSDDSDRISLSTESIV